MFMRKRSAEIVNIKSEEEIEKIAAAGKVVARVLDELAHAVKPGVTTMELSALADRLTVEMGAKASFEGYNGFPSSICASVNEQVIHGIPNRIPLKEGDIIGLDYGACLNGFHADSALSVPVGNVSDQARQLLKVTEDALWLGVRMVRPGLSLGDIGSAIQRHCERYGFSVVREMVGHGIGRDLHEAPEVPNYGKKGSGITLKRGMTICIEPMINAGRRDIVTLPDEWTIVTQDGRLSAHFEHTVAVTPGGVRVLTLRPGQSL
jgi:methionyl aminopeptidase